MSQGPGRFCKLRLLLWSAALIILLLIVIPTETKRSAFEDEVSKKESFLRDARSTLSNHAASKLWYEIGTLYQTDLVRNFVNDGVHTSAHKAISAYNEAFVLNNNSDNLLAVELSQRIGIIYELIGQFDDSIALYDRAIEISNNKMATSSSLNLKADLYLTIGRIEDALATITDTIKVDKDRIPSYWTLCKIYKEKRVSESVWRELAAEFDTVIARYRDTGSPIHPLLHWTKYTVSLLGTNCRDTF